MYDEVYESNCINCGEDTYSYIGFQDYCGSWCKYEHHNRIQREKAEEKSKKEEEQKNKKNVKSKKT